MARTSCAPGRNAAGSHASVRALTRNVGQRANGWLTQCRLVARGELACNAREGGQGCHAGLDCMFQVGCTMSFNAAMRVSLYLRILLITQRLKDCLRQC
jgi:hypothetical protein